MAHGIDFRQFQTDGNSEFVELQEAHSKIFEFVVFNLIVFKIHKIHKVHNLLQSSFLTPLRGAKAAYSQ